MIDGAQRLPSLNLCEQVQNVGGVFTLFEFAGEARLMVACFAGGGCRSTAELVRRSVVGGEVRFEDHIEGAFKALGLIVDGAEAGEPLLNTGVGRPSGRQI